MLKITITKSGIAAIGRRGFQEVGRESIRAAADYWWRKYLPLHFQNIAHLRYRYANRLPSTNRKKKDRLPFLEGVGDQTPAIGEKLPLVFSGRSRERALSHPNIKATAKNAETYNAQVIIDAPAFNFSAGKRINTRDEVTRDTPQENQTLEKIFAKEWDSRLRAKGLTAPRIRKTIAA